MKILLILPILLTVASALADDAIEIVSPDGSSTLLVDKSGRRDIIELKSGETMYRLFYEDLDSIFGPKLAEAFNASLSKVGKIVLPTFTSARWLSAEEIEITGQSSVFIEGEDNGDDRGGEFTFTAVVSKSGTVKELMVVPVNSDNS
jgi:hypothetical protein